MTVQDHLELAREKLNPNDWVKSGLPGRESQLDTIYTFLYNRLRIRSTAAEKKARVESGQVAKITGRHGGKTIFICGVPGTGKTASIMSVVSKLKAELKKKSPSINPFIPIYINSQVLLTPAAVYSEMYKQIFGKSCSNSERAQEQLDLIFRPELRDGSKISNSMRDIIKPFKLIVIDELDLLYNNKREDLFYNLFDWPTAADSNMILIAIANAMDLPERMRGKVSSRLGWEKLLFEPYKSEDLEKILRSRLGTDLLNKCFDKASIAIATKRVGRTTGDARRILDVCRHALTCAINRDKRQVTASIIDEVGFEKMDHQKFEYVSTCGPYHLLVLKGIMIQANKLGEEEVRIDGVSEQVFKLLQRSEIFRGTIIGPGQLLQVIDDLAAEGLIYLENSKPPFLKRLYLKDPSDVFTDLIKKQKIKVI